METIALINQKGGVAKTTSCINIADGLHRIRKNKILLIDLDPQGHLTKCFNVYNVNNVYDVFIGVSVIQDAIVNIRPNLDLIPSSMNLSGVDILLSKAKDREMRLKQAMEKITGYNYILIDCPPALNLLTINALVYVKKVIIPLQPEYLALYGVKQLLDTIEYVKENYNKDLKISGILLTRYDKRIRLHNEVLEQLEAYFKGKVYKTKIRPSIALAEAQSGAKTIFEYKPSSNGAKDYLALCREIIKGEG